MTECCHHGLMDCPLCADTYLRVNLQQLRATAQILYTKYPDSPDAIDAVDTMVKVTGLKMTRNQNVSLKPAEAITSAGLIKDSSLGRT